MKRLALLPILILLAGCGGAALINPGAGVTLTSIAVTPSSTSVNAGASLALQAVGTYSDKSTQDITSQVTWSSSTATVATVNTSGVVSAKSAGTSDIVAAYNKISGSSKLTVKATSSPTATLSSISVTPTTKSLTKGSTQQFTATGHYSDGTAKTLTSGITWSSSSTAIATISTSGLASAVAAGTATIRAASGSISGSASLTVTTSTSASATLTSITVSPSSTTVTAGNTLQFTATGHYSDGTTKTLTSGITWSSSSTAIATISTSGLASAVAAGTATIHAVSGSITGSASLTVAAASSGSVTLSSITVSPASSTITTGGTQQFTATANYSDGSSKSITSSVTWSSSTTAVATIASNGLASAVATGTSTITATSGTLSGSAVLTVSTATAAGGCDGAGNCYIYASANGSGNGSSWTNAYTGFGTGAGQISPSKMQRGVTYWIANGNYGVQNFSTPDSGTQTITIEGATATSHGPATDWNSSYAGKAVFGGGMSVVSTDYWTFEGQTRGPDWQSGYSLMFDINGLSGLNGVVRAAAVSHLIFDFVEVRGSNQNYTYNSNSSGCVSYCDAGFYTSSPTSNLYVGHSWIHDVGDTQFQSNDNSVNNSNGSNWIIEYNYISRDHTGDQSSGNHSEAFSSTVQNMVVRYNYFQDIVSSGVITDASGGKPDVGPWYVYGNIVFWTTNDPMNGTAAGLGDGLVSMFGETMHGTSYIVNNTIANLGVQPYCQLQGTACQMYFLYIIGGDSGTPTWNIQNNLVWNAQWGKPVNGSASGWITNVDYNAIFASGMTNSGSNAQTANINPFVNWTGSGTQLVPYESLNFSLAADTNSGNSAYANLPAGCTPGVNCMDTDMTGKQFGSNGVYERGALQR